MSGFRKFDDDDRVANLLIFGDRSEFTYYRSGTAALGFAVAPTAISGTGENDFLVGSDAANEIRGKGGNDQIFGNGGNDLLIGGQGDDILIGGDGVDTLRGGTGNDLLDGGSGLDYMVGYAGDDTYIVDRRGDIVYERQDGGHDVVGTFVSLRTPLWVEEIVALENAPINLVGNAHDNLMVGNSNNNRITGRAGADQLVGEEGDDVLIGNNGHDVLVASDGDDTLIGGNGKDVLDGGDGDDLIKGGKHSDVLFGGNGDDRLYGNAGPDVLLGGRGQNVLVGGKGSDRFTVEFPGEQFDVLRDFKVGEAGDRIVFAEDVLDGDLSDDILDGYVQTRSSGEWTEIAIDPNGGGNSFTAVMQLSNVAWSPANNLVVDDDGSLMIV